jgi:hypothetical protein
MKLTGHWHQTPPDAMLVETGEPVAEDDSAIHFSGVLGRASFSEDTVDLFFFPWTFEPDPEQRPLLCLTVKRSGLGPSEIEQIRNEGVEVSVYDNRIDVWREADHGQFSWDVEIVAREWVAYEIEDYAARIRQLDQIDRQERDDLTAAVQKIDKAIKLSHELIRRAEAKQAMSSEMRARQDEAIRVLKRVIAALEDKGG